MFGGVAELAGVRVPQAHPTAPGRSHESCQPFPHELRRACWGPAISWEDRRCHGRITENGCGPGWFGRAARADITMGCRSLRLTWASFILEPALRGWPQIGVREFGCYGSPERKLALRFRFRISPLRRGFLVFDPAASYAGCSARRVGKVIGVPPGARVDAEFGTESRLNRSDTLVMPLDCR